MADEKQFLEPPDDSLSTPKHQLMAFLGGPDDAAQATTELVAAGFPRDGIYVMVGEDAADKIDPTGKHHGLRGRVVRLTQRSSTRAWSRASSAR